MNSISDYISHIMEARPTKIVISKPAPGDAPFRKIVIDRKGDYVQLSKYTDKQVFHENIPVSRLLPACCDYLGNSYLQLHAWTEDTEYSLALSKNGRSCFTPLQTGVRPASSGIRPTTERNSICLRREK